MPKSIKSLPPSRVLNAKPKTTPYKLRDGGGLYLLVKPDGARLWRLDYRRPVTGKRNTLSLGTFPEVSLTRARDKLAEARKHLADGIDPGLQRQADKAARRAQVAADADAQLKVAHGTFRAVAQSWLDGKRKTWAAETRRKAELVLTQYLLPAVGDADMATLSSRDVRPVLEAMAAKVPNLTRKARGYVARIVEHAMQHGFREDGRVLVLRSEAIKDAFKEAKRGSIPAAINLADVRRVAQAVEEYPTPVTRAALKLAMFTAQRPGNVAAMEWSELDLEAAEWAIPGTKMKTGSAHVVPLAKQAVAELRAMQAFTDGKRYVFPPLARQRTPHLHRDALSSALRRMGLQGKHATHGFRAMFRTVARERLGIAADVLEAQLAHAKKDEVQKAYDRTAFLVERHATMQTWADYLDALRTGSSAIPLTRIA